MSYRFANISMIYGSLSLKVPMLIASECYNSHLFTPGFHRNFFFTYATFAVQVFGKPWAWRWLNWHSGCQTFCALYPMCKPFFSPGLLWCQRIRLPFREFGRVRHERKYGREAESTTVRCSDGTQGALVSSFLEPFQLPWLIFCSACKRDAWAKTGLWTNRWTFPKYLC